MLRFVKKVSETTEFVKPQGMHPVVYSLLKQRGIDSDEAARKFLNPSEEDLYDPMLLNDMEKAVEMIQSAVANGDRICVFGDYDADGVCSCAVMTVLMEKLEANYSIRIPSRHNDGYGLNMDAVEEIAKDHSLLITVDCGISCRNEIERAKELGLRCIVTDHHRPGELLPDCPVIDPLLNDYPFPWLCGAGVAFKLTQAILGTEEAMDAIDFAAIATIADIVSLTDENRTIVKLGLKKINGEKRPGIAELARCAGIENKTIDAADIAFKFGPRLNAAGRIDSAHTAYELLISKDYFDASMAADMLEKHNTTRKRLQDEIIESAMEQLRDVDLSAHKILLVRGGEWNHGVIGLAAAHLQSTYYMPVIVFAEKDGQLAGSCRSIPGVDIFKTLTAASELMVKFGGHSQAAGCTIRVEDFDALWDCLDGYIAENADPECYLPAAEYDMELPLDALDEDLVEALNALEPTGCGNTPPVFRATPQLLEKRACGQEGKHLQLIAGEGGKRVKGICFGEGALAKTLGDYADILYVPGLNEWQGRINVEIQVKSIRDADPMGCVYAIDDDIERLECNFLTDIVYNKRYSFKSNVPVISESELIDRMRKDIRGICVISSNTQVCVELMKAVGPDRIDFAAGGFPHAFSALNIVCVYPCYLDQLPTSVHTVVFADMPVPCELPEKLELLTLEGHTRSAIQAPNVDEMREVYKTARKLASQPLKFDDLYELDLILSEASGLPIEKCRLSMLALSDMKLAEVRSRRLTVPTPRKTDPQGSEVWRCICSMRDA